MKWCLIWLISATLLLLVQSDSCHFFVSRYSFNAASREPGDLFLIALTSSRIAINRSGMSAFLPEKVYKRSARLQHGSKLGGPGRKCLVWNWGDKKCVLTFSTVLWSVVSWMSHNIQNVSESWFGFVCFIEFVSVMALSCLNDVLWALNKGLCISEDTPLTVHEFWVDQPVFHPATGD